MKETTTTSCITQNDGHIKNESENNTTCRDGRKIRLENGITRKEAARAHLLDLPYSLAERSIDGSSIDLFPDSNHLFSAPLFFL